jgi:hypothetical protein
MSPLAERSNILIKTRDRASIHGAALNADRCSSRYRTGRVQNNARSTQPRLLDLTLFHRTPLNMAGGERRENQQGASLMGRAAFR